MKLIVGRTTFNGSLALIKVIFVNFCFETEYESFSLNAASKEYSALIIKNLLCLNIERLRRTSFEYFFTQ